MTDCPLSQYFGNTTSNTAHEMELRKLQFSMDFIHPVTVATCKFASLSFYLISVVAASPVLSLVTDRKLRQHNWGSPLPE